MLNDTGKFKYAQSHFTLLFPTKLGKHHERRSFLKQSSIRSKLYEEEDWGLSSDSTPLIYYSYITCVLAGIFIDQDDGFNCFMYA